jgi:uncharacterized protein (DUF305 family)
MKTLTALLIVAVAAFSSAAMAEMVGTCASATSEATPGESGAGPMDKGMMHPSIAVDASYVYEARGSEVLKFNKNDLSLVSSAMLPQPSGAGMGAGPGGSVAQASQFDRGFLRSMIDHHMGAIDMSRLAERKATHAQLRSFARDVVATQSRENQQFGTWLSQWYGVNVQPQVPADSRQMLNAMAGLSGREFEIEYMRSMIAHHMQGIQMARTAERSALHPEVRVAARNIASAQTNDIRQLRSWLSSWYGVAAP